MKRKTNRAKEEAWSQTAHAPDGAQPGPEASGTSGQSVPKLACSVMPPLPTKSCDFAGAPSSEVEVRCAFCLRLVAIAPSLILRENRKSRGAVFDGSPDNT